MEVVVLMKEKCERCSKNAIFFDINLELWLCDDCLNKEYNDIKLDEFIKRNDKDIYNEELNNILIAMEKLCNSIKESNNKAIEKQFRNRIYSKDLNELLSTMTREMLAKIAEALGISKVYKYNGSFIIIL